MSQFKNEQSLKNWLGQRKAVVVDDEFGITLIKCINGELKYIDVLDRSEVNKVTDTWNDLIYSYKDILSYNAKKCKLSDYKKEYTWI